MLFPSALPLLLLMDQRLSLCPILRKVIKVLNPKLIWLILNPLLDLTLGSLVVQKLLMFVTIVVFLDTFVLIVSSCILISKCPNDYRFPLKVQHLCLESY